MFKLNLVKFYSRQVVHTSLATNIQIDHYAQRIIVWQMQPEHGLLGMVLECQQEKTKRQLIVPYGPELVTKKGRHMLIIDINQLELSGLSVVIGDAPEHFRLPNKQEEKKEDLQRCKEA